MALNYSSRPIYSHIPEYNMWSPMKRVSGFFSEGISENYGEGRHGWPWHVNRGESQNWRFNFRGDTFDFLFSPEPNSKDVIDLLPSDPFGMDMETTLISELHVEEKVLEDPAKSEGIPIPCEALLSILNSLGVKDLLSVESVCKSLYSTVRSEPWLWRTIQIESPLSERITDDMLCKLVSRAGGKLQCLSLVECPKVTDDGIRRILETNPELTKLSVPGCTRLTVDGILNSIKAHNSREGVPGIKHLRIGQLYGVTREVFEELNSLLGLDGAQPENHQKPHFYHRGNFYLPFDDDRAMDIDMCPRCAQFRLVYNCPAERCQVKEAGATQLCRACVMCTPRCSECGVCFGDSEFVETFCLDLVCSHCDNKSKRCEDKLDEEVVTCGPLHEPIQPR